MSKGKFNAGGVRREFAVDTAKIEAIFGTINYEPKNEYEALMQAAPGEEPNWNPLVEELRRAVYEAVLTLSEKDQFCLNAIYAERVTFEELGARLGYGEVAGKSKSTGPSSAYHATQRALKRLKAALEQHPLIQDYLGGTDE